MPVQINELVIRANVVEPGEKQDGGAPPKPDGGAGAVNKEEIIKECAALVLEIINKKNQR